MNSQTGHDLMDLGGKTAIVTGAGQGVGRAIALRFAEHGAAAVVVNDFHIDRAEAVAEEVEAAGAKALAVRADVTDFDAVMAMFDQVRSWAGGVQILVNNAGNMGPETPQMGTPFWEQMPEDWDKYIRVNLYGVMNCVRAALGDMVEGRKGSIVTIISDAGRIGEPHLIPYSGAKGGAASFMRAIAKSVGRYDIRANSVSISTTRTPTVELPADDSDDAKKLLSRYILRRFGKPEDAANMVLFLSSDAASWITGQTYPVNGGYALAL